MASVTWFGTWALLRLATYANASPPVKAATNPLACSRSPISKQLNATASVANCAQVSLIHPRRYDHAIIAPPSSPTTTPMISERTSVRKMNHSQ